jgi:hypothetical protein
MDNDLPQFYDFSSPEDVDEFQSKIDKVTKKNPNKTVKTEDKKKPEKKPVELSMSERYKKSWEIVYKKQPEWRRKEIDIQLKSGKLSDKECDKDFIQQVASLAEDGTPLEA